jgi:D-3-phosphoglycerate dehydrogenase
MFRVGVTRDFLRPDGRSAFPDVDLEPLAKAGLEWGFLPTADPEIRAEHARDFDGLLVLSPKVTSGTLEGVGRLQIVARFGVGYDNVDVLACTRAGVLLAITPDAVRRPVAVGALTFVLALSQKLLIKDRLTRAGHWAEKTDHTGQGLLGRTLGLVGLGNIGREIAALARPFGLRLLAADPAADPAAAAALDVGLVPLDELLRRSDFVVVCCALTPATRHLLNRERLALLKPTAYLVNVARGPVVDQAALTEVLAAGRIAGAGLDVFEQEPVDPADPLLLLENVIVTPHAISWTDENFREVGRSVVGALVDVAQGRVPKHVVNREAVRHERLRHLKGTT